MTTTTSFAVLLAASVCLAAPGDDSRKAFVEDWQGTRVVVRQTLYTLVYNERGRLGRIYRDKHEGLSVVTPLAGAFLQFDGRDSEQDITGGDPQRVMEAITETYRRDKALDIGSFQRIEPVVVWRYDPGVQLVVTNVRIEQSRVRMLLAQRTGTGEPGEPETALTVQWPTDLSRSFTERPEVEKLIGQFLSVAPVSPPARR